jgi:hypothetical protein
VKAKQKRRTPTDWGMDHSGTSLLLAVCLSLFTAYCVLTVSYWDIDNQYPSLFPHMTLAQWVWVNQIQHVWKMLHDLW